jgi:predicted nuclease of restriction endonuclease-like (RecB) superfamily
MARIEGCSVRNLRARIDSMLYERTALSKQPDAMIRQELAIPRSTTCDTVLILFCFRGQ